MGIALTDLAITKTSDKTSVLTGDVVTYMLTITNLGPAPAEQIPGQTSILVKDNAPPELENLQYSMDNGATWDTWTGVVELPTMAVGQIEIVYIQGTVGKSTEEIIPKEIISNTATVSYLFAEIVSLDTNMSNNTSTVDIRVRKHTSREDVINQIVSSIAMEELALSHVINAEGEKIQYILGTLSGVSSPAASIDDVLKVNSSVRQTLKTILQNQMFLNNKLTDALSAYDLPSKPKKPIEEPADLIEDDSVEYEVIDDDFIERDFIEHDLIEEDFIEDDLIKDDLTYHGSTGP